MGETGEMVARKVRAALDEGPRRFCVGRLGRAGERRGSQSELGDDCRRSFRGQEGRGFPGGYRSRARLGHRDGQEARPDDAARVSGRIRETVDSLFGKGVSEDVRVLYGGSVKSTNIRSFMMCEEIDGALVGGASLDPVEFARLVFEVLRARPDRRTG